MKSQHFSHFCNKCLPLAFKIKLHINCGSKDEGTVPGSLVLSWEDLNVNEGHPHPPHGLCPRGTLSHQTRPGCFQSTSRFKMHVVLRSLFHEILILNPPGLSKATCLWLSCPWTRELRAHDQDLPALLAEPGLVGETGRCPASTSKLLFARDVA